MVPVNLQVDINQIENLGEDVIVSVRSNLTSWSPVGMDDSDGDGIYEKTINIGASVGQSTEFVYVFRLQSIVNGLSIVQYEGSGGNDCLYDGSDYGYELAGNVRILSVPSQVPSDFNVSTCWDECTATCEVEEPIFVDCNGNEAPENWLGDGYCDNGVYSSNGVDIYFDCEDFNWDEGDCPDPNAEVLGCTDSTAFNYNPEANTDDGLCEAVIEGCLDEIALNFNELANISDGSCILPLFGCTDPESPNYNPLAEADNGSCVNQSCSDGEAKMILQITLDQYPGETGWILTDISTGQPVESVTAGEYTFDQANTTIPYQLCVPTSGVELVLSDTYGDGLIGLGNVEGDDGNFIMLADTEPCGGGLDTVWSLDSANFNNAIYSGPIWLPYCEIPPIFGCMDVNFVEYNVEANVDSPEECQTEKAFGCIDDSQFNFDPNANTMELVSPCNYTITLEDDAADGWGDSYLAVFHGEQEWIFTLGPGIESQSWDLVLESDKSIEVYYFQVKAPQQPIEEVEFQTLHNSFRIVREDEVELLDGGTNPFEDNGLGILQPFQPPFWNVYSAQPYCGNVCEPVVYGCIYPTNLANPDIVMFNYDSLANTYDPDIIECEPVKYGCTDPTLYGYNWTNPANTDDGSCQPWFIGCTEEEAWNYQPLANLNDSESCLYFGCIDELALNFDPTANVNNDNCIYPVFGCTNPMAFNYNVDANVDDESCIPEVYGCMDPTMWNYNELANMPSDNCIPFIYGCTDNAALNYNPIANTDNESCIPLIPGCMDVTALNYNLEATLEDGSCIEILFGCTDELAFNYNPLANVDNESCIPVVPGCTDPNAFNYNLDANLEDFSCIDVVFGCIDSLALNYNVSANVNDGSCVEIIQGCMDSEAYNYDIFVNLEDGSCLYDCGCVGEPGEPYWLNDTCYAWVLSVDVSCCVHSWDATCIKLYNYCSEEYSVGLDDLRDDEILIYPNPTTDIVNITAKKDIKIDVTNLLGETITTIENENQIDLSRFSNGMYIFNITYNNIKVQHKVIKQ